ncbi:precorrin-6Y C5,15-methyltransferase (decarboxylating) subunit CbiT [Halorubrum luteum]
MPEVALPHDATAGPTKPEVRAVTLEKLALEPTDHFVDVGSCTGSVSIEAAHRVRHVTAIERDPQRLEITKKNLAANEYDAEVGVRAAEAPEGIPEEADAMFLGGSRNFEAVLDVAVEAGIERIVMNAARLEVAGRAVEAFRERGILEEVVRLQVSHGYELAGATSFDARNPVYVIVGRGEGGGLA